ncbi:CBS domain-containing protein [Methanogenium organophilum]|uniref:CBS domain-containing protein n=1 Tax=Methanogenium organophilum TaxID=2199 RepID=A0A9X9T7E7_METOG|nr:CBS domain-containing protein [Methanogenium organophilum]WAI01283.1 CBS domain-containing protein [Methanogenium organophilum]
MMVALDLIREIPVLYPDDLVTKARKYLREDSFREMFIRDRNGRLVGYIDISDVILVNDTKSNLEIQTFLRDAPFVYSEDSVENALAQIKNAQTDSVAVCSHSGELLGAVQLSALFPVIMSRQNPTGLVSEYMIEPVVTCNRDDPLHAVYSVITESGYDALPVEEGNCILGMISRTDLIMHGHIRRSIEAKHKTPVEYVMVTPAIITFRNDSIGDAARAMIQHDVSRLPVIESDGKIVGIVSRQDILNALELPGVVHAQKYEEYETS